MGSTELVQQYFKVFYESYEFEKLYKIFDAKLKFIGPFIETESADAYIAQLISDPAMGCSYEIINWFEQGDKVNVIYWFKKGELKTIMSQLFECEGGIIKRIILVYDSGVFKGA